MCGRFSLTKNIVEVKQRFDLDVIQPSQFTKTYNAAPTQWLPVITNRTSHTLQFFRWGLIPHWAKDDTIGNKMINARAETLTEKVSFKKLVEQQRCLVVSDGFYEWKKTERGKQPYRITLTDEKLFAFAGLWSSWTDKETGELVHSFSIITTEANALVKDVHDRMPVILSKEAENHWLEDGLPEKEYLNLLRPYPAKEMDKYPIANLVNSPGNNSPELISRLNSA